MGTRMCGIHIFLPIMGVKHKSLQDEMITTPFTYASATRIIVQNGLKPVFRDVDPVNFAIDVNRIERIAKPYHLKMIYNAVYSFGVT